MRFLPLLVTLLSLFRVFLNIFSSIEQNITSKYIKTGILSFGLDLKQYFNDMRLISQFVEDELAHAGDVNRFFMFWLGVELVILVLLDFDCQPVSFTKSKEFLQTTWFLFPIDYIANPVLIFYGEVYQNCFFISGIKPFALVPYSLESYYKDISIVVSSKDMLMRIDEVVGESVANLV